MNSKKPHHTQRKKKKKKKKHESHHQYGNKLENQRARILHICQISGALYIVNDIGKILYTRMNLKKQESC